MIMSFLFLVIGFLLLIKGADWLVGSASKLAKTFGISSLVIGLTVVAFGTSAPEAAIGIFSGIKQANQITLGDVIGSSIANIALIIGILAVMLPLPVERSVITREVPISLGIQVVFFILIAIGASLSRFDGVLLLILFLLFLFYVWHYSKQSIVSLDENDEMLNKIVEPSQEGIKIPYRVKLFLIFLVGLACMILGGNLVVDNSVKIAHSLGISEALIGVTVVALGTSLPELVTCIVATMKKESDIAIGNIIGSNIFNILFVLGLSSVIHPIGAAEGTYMDIVAMLASTLLIYMLMLLQKKITRLGGTILLSFYLIFIVSKILMTI